MEKNFKERMYKAKIVFVVAVLVAVLGYSLSFWPQEYRQMKKEAEENGDSASVWHGESQRRWFWLPFGN